MNYPLRGLLVGLFTLILVAGCGDSASPPASDQTTGGSTPPTQESTAPETDQGPVAIVNGKEIARADFDEQLSQVEASYAQQGVPFPAGEELAQLQQQVVTRLVQQELVLQESEVRGMTASDEEIEAEFQAAASGFSDEEAFNQALEAEGLTRDEIKGLIAENIKITKLLDSVVQEAQLAPPTEEELRELYALAGQQQELPPFEEVRVQLEAELQSQREDEVLQSFVQELEATGTVEILWTS
jgi:peptidyl-prolyl cis-trans isomerase SurA